ncbi:hypothetical protein SADUNF_Sadunf13G0028800 [Salix dunnii]|uniref:Uncharacterized protein n=1 Tax=Salix dunnii TaxID=1413687 RepID=A0A835MQV5_9ROSI|nr:hypothetical protein SADUNF_Sadunf13G0028800 [Salix dunnii]
MPLFNGFFYCFLAVLCHAIIASKAVSEAQTLCVVETLLVMFPRGNRHSSPCHLCVEAVMKRLADPGNTDFDKHMAEHQATLDKLNKQYFDMLKELDAQKQRGKELDELEKTRGKSLLDAPINDLNLHELETLRKSLEELKVNLLKQIEKVSADNKNPYTSSSANIAGVINPSVSNTAKGSSSANINDDGHRRTR